MKKGAKQELYFSSSNQDNQHMQSTTKQTNDRDNKRDNHIREDEINQLSSYQIFQLFFDQVHFHQLLKRQDQHPQIIQKFIWRVHYLLGETVLNVQKILAEDQIIKNCLLLQNEQIERIVYLIIEKAKLIPLGQDFIKIKTHIDQFYKHSDYDTHKLSILYSEFVKLSRGMVKFDMVLNFTTIEDDHKRKKAELIKTNNMEAELNQNYNQSKTQASRTQPLTISQAYSPIASTKAKPQVNGSSGGKTAANSYEIEKGGNRKWSPTEEAIFCKIYSETDSPVVCAQLMQKQAGPDGRWKTPNQIQDKMSSLAAKVFQKFESLSTSNETIKTFRQNKKIVFELQRSIKKKIFRNIAIIYESMLNVSEQKKAIISQKILQVNRQCRDATHMK